MHGRGPGRNPMAGQSRRRRADGAESGRRRWRPVAGRSQWCLTNDAESGIRWWCRVGAGDALLQKQFVVSAGNRSLVPTTGSNALCVIQKMTIFYAD
jgi:hypothetical protein